MKGLQQEREREEDAGDFTQWLAGFDAHASNAVPCGDCTACCRASQFIHVEVDEPATHAIRAAHLFPAPGSEHLVLGHDPNGRCPMLSAGDACSIYSNRPKACHSYDCRIFAASDVYPEEATQREVASRARRWRFSYSTPEAQRAHDAVRRAARFVAEHARDLFGHHPANAIRTSLFALRVASLFENEDTPDPLIEELLRAP